VITLGSSGIIALFRRRDEHHERARTSVEDESGPLVVPAGILGEVTYMLELRGGTRVVDAFLVSLLDGTMLLDCGERDFYRIRELIGRYANLPLGFADAAVIACAERRGGRVLTYDQRHFPVVAVEGTITVVGG
jgi:predicted nucleic acid-binding protein